MSEPSEADLRAVQKALGSRHRELQAHLETIDTMQRLGGRGNPDFGPAAPEERGFAITIERMQKVAQEIRNTRKAVSAVDFDAGDKQKLKASLSAAAKSWDARAEMFGSLEPAVVEAAQKKAEERDLEAGRLGRAVSIYFGDAQPGEEEED